jgi:hypothetical protein
MKKLYLIIMVVILCCVSAFPALSAVLVIVNKNNSSRSMDKAEVSALYLGRYQAFKDGSFALPFDLPADGEVRKEFYEKLTGKSVAYINAYWARILFTGRATPPRQLDSDKMVMDVVKKNPSAIGYVSADIKLDSNVKVILRLE